MKSYRKQVTKQWAENKCTHALSQQVLRIQLMLRLDLIGACLCACNTRVSA